MAEIKDGSSSKMFRQVPRLALLASASLAGIVGAGFLAHAMLTPSLPTMPSSPATAQMYVIPEYQPPSPTPDAVRPAEPLPAAAEAPTKDVAAKPTKVAAIPPKPLARPLEVSRRCEADECVSWEDTVTKALAAPGPGQARSVTPRASATQPVVMLDGPTQPVSVDEPLMMQREPSTVGGMAKSAASTVVTQSGKLVDDLMRWSDKTVSKLVPPRWASADDQTTQQQ